MSHFVPSAVVLLSFAAPVLAAGDQSADLTELRESFDDGRWSRHWWSIDQRSPPGVKVDLSGSRLRFVVPPGPAGRPPATMKGRFFLEGDFDIRVDYTAQPLPQPKSEWINLQIFIDGAGGPAAVMRTNNSKAGSGYSLWWEPRAEGVKGGWALEPSASLQGTLRLTRVGEILRFWYADNSAPISTEVQPATATPPSTAIDPIAEGFVEIGSAKYGADTITNVELWVSVPELTSPVDVTFDNVFVKADGIRDPSVAAAPLPLDSWGPYRLISIASVFVLAIVGFITWRAHTR